VPTWVQSRYVNPVLLRIDPSLVRARAVAAGARKINALSDRQRSRISGDLDAPPVDEDVAAVHDQSHERKEQRQRNQHQDQRLAAFSTLSLSNFDQVSSVPQEDCRNSGPCSIRQGSCSANRTVS
jgi:hypothetical protein